MDPVVPTVVLIAVGIVGYFVWHKYCSMPTKPEPKKSNEDQDIPF